MSDTNTDWGPYVTPVPGDDEEGDIFSRATKDVQIPRDQTITEYLEAKGLEKGIQLEADTAIEEPLEIEVEHGSNKYEIKKVIAQGGMGIIYRVRDRNCRRHVAMKLLSVKQQSEGESILRFIEEAQITSQLEHPNIIPIHEMALDGEGNIFYIMKYVRGVTLTDVLMNIRRSNQETIEQYPLSRLLTIFLKVCDAVAFAHSRGVVHRDLKPDNIMIGDFGEVLVMDWGLAKVVRENSRVQAGVVPPEFSELTATALNGPQDQADEEEEDGIQEEETVESIRTGDTGTDLRTISGRVMGTPGFMAPEQASPYGPGVTSVSDIYSLGAILYSLLVLRPTQGGKDIKKILQRIREGLITSPVEYNHPDPADDSVIRLLHLPDEMVPAALSDIAMKCLETRPADRYQSVQELQRDIEAYQQGRIWHLVTDEDFSGDDLFDRWEVIGGQYELNEDGFHLSGGEPQLLLLKQPLTGDVRIEFECYQDSIYLNDVGCFMSAVLSENRHGISASGYELKYGGYDNSCNVLMRSDQTIWSLHESPLEQNKLYRVSAERIGSRLRLTVNNREIYDVNDPDPLTGADRTAVGLLGWVASTWYKRIKVYSLGTPRRSDILDVAERQMQKGRYCTAMDLFSDVLESFPDEARRIRAERGYHTAERREQLQRNLEKWQHDIEQVWPGLGARLRMDNNGLTMDINNAGIADLSPVSGLPLTCLYCASNHITSLEPIRGMDLLKLDCSGNPINSLDPLKGMPLHTLVCECCEVETLRPLSETPLSLLNCGGNPLLDGLAPLRKVPLTWLSCWGCGIHSLAPLTGKHLTALYCDVNEITSLEVLSRMALHTLHCGGNRIESLAPLRGMDLRALHCSNNQISDLEPLRGMKLSMFSCHCNQITSLAPLDGMPLGALVCGNNPLDSIQPFIQQPPVGFQFDCDSISTDDLQWLHDIWAANEHFAEHARNTAVLLAVRRHDVEALRRLAKPFDGHRYLYIPKFMCWEDARELCHGLGGHLVVIPSQHINDFISSLFPQGSWFWIGLYTHPGGEQEWVNHQPFDYDAYIDPLRRELPGPKLFFSGLWTRDTLPDACNCFMIEWDA